MYKDGILGLLLIFIGIGVVTWDLLPIYQFKMAKGWPVTNATIKNIATTGMLFHLRRTITFSYQVNSKTYEAFQILPKDSWVGSLKKDDVIEIRYSSDKPQTALINHFHFWDYVFIACWNSALIILGLWLMCHKR